MNYIQNPKLLALAQVAFYGAIGAFLPALIDLITNGGVVIPYGLTGIVLVILNYTESMIQTNTGKGMFGAIS